MAFAQRLAAVPCSKVEISISCRNLQDKDITSKSDPCAVLKMQDKGTWYEMGRTENVQNSLDPNFAKTFEVDYFFEEVQNLQFLVYDLDNKTPELSDDDFLGSIECTMGQLVSGSPYMRPLMAKNGKKQAGKGQIIIRATEVAKLNDLLHLSFKATSLDKKDFLSKSDPYLEFSRQLADGTYQVVHRTEVIKNTLNPTWRPFKLKTQKLCAGEYQRSIKVACYDYDESDEADLIGEFMTSVPQMSEAIDKQVECYDYDSDGSHDLIGVFATSVNEMMKAVDQKIEWACIHPKKKAKKKSYKDSGTVILTNCKVTKEYSFLDYVFGGMQINFTVGIDFTASNGDPRTPQSLHYINPYEPNEYSKAIQSVGAVIQDYDSDQMFPALGFGARVPPTMEVSHEFALNFNPSNPYCAGIHGIMQAYTACIPQVQLYGPTNFSPIIYHVAKFAAAAQKEEGARSYFVLLIITDGVISDMESTLSAIVYASTLPMSIIIVGVGQADFTAMNLLDGDDGVLKSPRGERARRDIVQFVPFRDFIRAPPAELAKHVLAEVPQQVVDYYKMVGIAPSAPQSANPAAPPAQ